jgi:hypothetical protein
MPLDLAEAICGSETALEAVALLLVFAGVVFAGAAEDWAIELEEPEFEGAAIEFAGGVLVAGAACAAGAGSAEAAGVVPESVFDFLLLRVFFAGAAVLSVLAAVAGADAAGAAGVAGAAPESAAVFFDLRVFLVPVSVAVADVSGVAAASVEAVFFFLVFLAGVAVASVAAAWSLDAVAPVASVAVLAFFFFFLVVVVAVWSSVEAGVWGLAKALTPDMTNKTQSTIIHVLNLVCSLLMISSSHSRQAFDFHGNVASGASGALSSPSAGRP